MSSTTTIFGSGVRRCLSSGLPWSTKSDRRSHLPTYHVINQTKNVIFSKFKQHVNFLSRSCRQQQKFVCASPYDCFGLRLLNGEFSSQEAYRFRPETEHGTCQAQARPSTTRTVRGVPNRKVSRCCLNRRRFLKTREGEKRAKYQQPAWLRMLNILASILAITQAGICSLHPRNQQTT